MDSNQETKRSPVALLPIGVFLAFYIGLSLIPEFGFPVENSFYRVPITVALLAALFVAFLPKRKQKMEEKLTMVAKNLADKDMCATILTVLMAGVFVGVIGRESAAAVVHIIVALVPVWAGAVVLFALACLLSLAMGDTVGTIAVFTPVAVAMADIAGLSYGACIGAVISGAVFGGNVSIASSANIAACKSHNCDVGTKYRANAKISIPAVFITLVILLLQYYESDLGKREIPSFHIGLLLPYVLVLIAGFAGLSVFKTLLIGIVSGVVITPLITETDFVTMLENIGAGMVCVSELVMITVLMTAVSGMVRERGGFEGSFKLLRKIFKGKIGGRLGIGILAGMMDVATANNTAAIMLAAPIAKQMAQENDITAKDSAALIDIFSSIVQGILPYGTPILMAVAIAASMGVGMSPFEVIPFVLYPVVLAAWTLLDILVNTDIKDV